jgi:hypothetical protein
LRIRTAYPSSRVSFVVVLLVAEIGSSLWRLLRFPSDIYPGSLNYVGGRLLFWLPLVIIVNVLWSLIEKRFESSIGQPNAEPGKRKQASQSAPLVLALGFAIETFTSIGYWMTPYSRGVRALYESVWYWHRVPSQGDYGWPSFKGYFVDHLIPWVVFFLMGLSAWYVSSRRRVDHP